MISTLSDPWDAKVNKTHLFDPKSSPASGGKREWNSKCVNELLQYCEISAIKKLAKKYGGK